MIQILSLVSLLYVSRSCFLSLVLRLKLLCASLGASSSRSSLSSFLGLVLTSGLHVDLLSLTLLKTFSDGGAACAHNHVDRLGGIIVSWNHEVDVAGIGVGVNDSEHGDAQTLGLADSDLLLHHVNHEEGRRQTGQVGDRTEVLLQLSALAANLKVLTL